jgi:hypothetical protein
LFLVNGFVPAGLNSKRNIQRTPPDQGGQNRNQTYQTEPATIDDSNDYYDRTENQSYGAVAIADIFLHFLSPVNIFVAHLISHYLSILSSATTAVSGMFLKTLHPPSERSLRAHYFLPLKTLVEFDRNGLYIDNNVAEGYNTQSEGEDYVSFDYPQY